MILALLCLQATWVVDDGGGAGVDFTDIPAAVAAAADGDLIRVRAGAYTHFRITGKGLRIVGDLTGTFVDRASATVAETTEIVDVPAESQVFLENLRFPRPFACVGPRLRIQNTRWRSTTRVALARVVAEGQVNACAPAPAALEIRDAEVLIADSSLTGGPGNSGPFDPHGGAALAVYGESRVWVVGSTLLGGSGSNGAAGGAGLLASDGRVWIADSAVRGGRGWHGTTGDAAGGPGIRILEARVRVSGDPDDRVQGGPATFVGGPGIVGPPENARVHDVGVWSGDADLGSPGVPQTTGFSAGRPFPVLDVGGVLTPTGSVSIHLRNGPPGAPFALWLDGTAPGRMAAPSSFGPLGWIGELALRRFHLRAPPLSGRLSATGAFQVTLPAAPLGGLLHRPLTIQAAMPVGGGDLLLSNPEVFSLHP